MQHIDILETIKSRLSLSALISQEVRLKRRGKDYLGLCPFHREKTPSFTVNEEKGFFHCFGCGAHGSLFDFLMKTQNISFKEAIEKAAALAGVSLPLQITPETQTFQKIYDTLEKAHGFFKETLLHRGAKCWPYLKKRGLREEDIIKFDLGYAPSERASLFEFLHAQHVTAEEQLKAGLIIENPERPREYYDRFRNRLIFPIRNTSNKIVAFGGRLLETGQPKYLNSPETAVFKKGQTLYNYGAIKKLGRLKDPLFVAEGYIDVIALESVGYHAVAPLGTSLTEGHLELLWRLTDTPILCFDGDEAGQNAASRAALRALPFLKPGKSLLFLPLPRGEDPDTLIKREGKTAIEKRLEHAIPLSHKLWQDLTLDINPKTPEEKAHFKQHVLNTLQEIKDLTVKNYYLSDFKENIDLFLKRSYKSKGKLFVSLKHLNQNHVDYFIEQARILLASIIKFPDLLFEIEEHFMQLEFPFPGSDSLKENILSAVFVHSILDESNLKYHLYSKGFAKVIEQVFDNSLVLHASFLESKDKEKVKANWLHIYTRYQDYRNILIDLEEAKENFATTQSPEAWTKYHHLKKMVLNFPFNETQI